MLSCGYIISFHFFLFFSSLIPVLAILLYYIGMIASEKSLPGIHRAPVGKVQSFKALVWWIRAEPYVSAVTVIVLAAAWVWGGYWRLASWWVQEGMDKECAKRRTWHGQRNSRPQPDRYGTAMKESLWPAGNAWMVPNGTCYSSRCPDPGSMCSCQLLWPLSSMPTAVVKIIPREEDVTAPFPSKC